MISWTTRAFLRGVTWWRSNNTLDDAYAFHKEIVEKEGRSTRWSEHHMHLAVQAGLVIRQHRKAIDKFGYWHTDRTRWRFVIPELVAAELARRHAEVVERKAPTKGKAGADKAPVRTSSSATGDSGYRYQSEPAESTGPAADTSYGRSMMTDIRQKYLGSLARKGDLPPPQK